MEDMKMRFESLESNMEREPKGREKIETTVILEFMRHGKKESDPSKADEDVRLSPEGRMQATERGKELSPQPDVSIAYGSPRKRTQETAGRILFSGAGIDDPDLTLENMEEEIKASLKKGEKIREDVRLNFNTSGPVGKAALEAFKAGRYLGYLIEESDAQAVELSDAVSTTYMRQAGNVAELIWKFSKIGGAFNRIASQTDKYEKYGNQLERYFGTHLGVAECFVAKALEEVKGQAAKDEFVRSVGSGFAETEGVHIEIVNRGTDQTIRMTYGVKDPHNGDRKETIDIGADVLKKIIEDREKFDMQVGA